MRPYQLRLKAREAQEIFTGPADYVRIGESPIALHVESPDNDELITLSEGDDARLTQFRRLRISHDAAGEVPVLVYVGRGTQASSARLGGDVSIRQGGALALAAVTVTGTAAAEICTAEAARRALHVRNTGGAAVGLGPAGITTSTAPILLEPGEEWREEAAAAASWFAVTDAGQSTTLAVLEVS